MNKKQKVYLPFKRFMDVLLSTIALICLLPILIILSIAIKFDSKGPIFFRQKRIGVNNSTFNILKFRTMKTNAPSDAPTDQLKDATSWITKSGKILRKTSLDELPQLINILKGEMSIVGPRPALWNQYYLKSLRTENGISKLKPGLTGLAQINGRDENNDDEKVHYDKIYLENFGLICDIGCILGTIKSVISSKGVIDGDDINA